MNHAGKYGTFDRTATRPRTGKATRRTRLLRGFYGKTTRCKRSVKGQATVSACGDASHAFLRTDFAPKLANTDLSDVCLDSGKMERDFYSSLSLLNKQLKLSLAETEQLGFPCNMACAMDHLQRALKATGEEWQDIRLVEDEGSVFFARQQRFDTGMTLYYIPVEPLFYMLRDNSRKKASHLLLSAFAYLFQVARIPYHRHEGNYLNYTYDMLNDWKMQDDEEDLAFVKEYRCMEYIGDVIELKIQNPANLLFFQKRVQGFYPKDDFDRDCLKLAERAFALFSKYSHGRIYDKFREGSFEEEEDDLSRQISLDNYISFYGSACGELSDLVIETVNTDLQEFTSIDEPTIFLPIDGRDISGNNFDFETKLFTLLEDLSILLNDYRY